MTVTIRVPETDRRAFINWLEECLERCGVNPSGIHNEIDLSYDNVYRYRKGLRNPSPVFLARTLLLIRRKDGFSDPGEVVQGLGLLDISPEQIPQLIKETLASSSEGERFLEWLGGWDQPSVSPRQQGVRLPPEYVEREALHQLKDLLLSDEAARRMYIWGMGGIGKSTLVKAAALDDDVQRHYVHGVLWAELGTNAKPRESLAQWCKLLGLATSANDTVEELAYRLEIFLNAPWRRFLIVIDDVWQAQDAEPFLVDAPGSRVLITTREKHIAQKLGVDDHIVELAPMTHQEAEALIRRRLGTQWAERDREYARKFIDFVDGLPLALSIGAAVVKQRGWPFLLTRLPLRQKALPTLAFSKPEGRADSLRVTIDASYDWLPPKEKELFARLGMFSAGDVFTVADAYFYWRLRALLSGNEKGWSVVADHLQELVDMSLVIEVETRTRYRVHTLLGHYAAEKVEEREDVNELWDDFITNARDNLLHGVARMGHLSPRGHSRFLNEQWPHIERAWRQFQKRWRWLSLDEGEACERALKRVEGFGLLGCRVLWGRRAWREVAQWAGEARALYQEVHQELWEDEEYGRVWDRLLLWEIDAALQQGRTAGLPPLLDELEKATRDSDPAWDVRYQVRRARWHLLRDEKEEVDELLGAIRGTDDELLARERNVGRALHALTEVYELRGDYAARWGSPEEAERHWWMACECMVRCIIGQEIFGFFDGRRLEQTTERIVLWRASHRLWREAARLADLLLTFRAWLGEGPGDLLFWFGAWSLKGRDMGAASRAIDRLEDLGDLAAYTQLKGDARLLESLIAARDEKWNEAETLLEEAMAAYGGSPSIGKEWERLVDGVVKSVRDREQPSLLWSGLGSPYDLPTEEENVFDDWFASALGGLAAFETSRPPFFTCLKDLAEE